MSTERTAEELVKAALDHAAGKSGKKLRVIRPVLDARGNPCVDADGNILRRWGPQLPWFDEITSPCQATDADFFLHRNGLFLAIEFKHASEGEDGDGELQWAQWRTLADLAQTGLFVCYVVKYSAAGNGTTPPTITSLARITDEAAPFPVTWRPCTFGGLLNKVEEWWTNANDREFVRRQRAAATLSQFMQFTLWGFRSLSYRQAYTPDTRGRRARQFEALRLASRDVRTGKAEPVWSAFEAAFKSHDAQLTANEAAERSTA